MNEPFERDRLVDKPGIVGARWWHASLADQASQMARRDAIRNILIAGGVIAGFGALMTMCVKAATDDTPSKDDYRDDRKTSLDMQKDYGWSFGAIGEPLVFDGVTTRPFDPSALPTLADTLRPAQRSLAPYYQPTLFESPFATPRALGTLDPYEAQGFQQLAPLVKPISTAAMDAAYACGKSLASLFASLAEKGGAAADAKTGLVVDLPGAEAVAFAAGAATVFDPVFLFDNWPHPRGVVRAQETLSAAAYYQPLFAKERGARVPVKGKPPMFVLDRRRLAPYTDDATQFDNRYVAKLPWPAASLSPLGVERVLYVVPARSDASRELDDLNDELVAYSQGGVDVRAISLDMFSAPPAGAAPALDAGAPPIDTGGVYYGGTPGSHWSFFTDYPWAKSPRPATARPASNPGASYRPVARTSSYSNGTGSAVNKPRPPNFGTVPVVIAIGTGAIVAAKYSRSGSWNRSSGSWGG
jgi:hypothetical protein